MWGRGRPGWSGRRGAAARVAAVEAYPLGGAVLERFGSAHPEVAAEDVELVVAAARQWFGVLAARPGGEAAVPSQAVAGLWAAMVADDETWAVLCADVLGDTPVHRTPPEAGEESGGAGLAVTLAAARREEPDAPGGLPLLFRVDAAVGVLNARRYLADCGGGTQCHPSPGVQCLVHLDGPGRPARGRVKGGATAPAELGLVNGREGGRR